ncbi:MAG TPA: Hsp20/alpha crystallin family protein [Gemmataceae bacterium]|jgi:HSP20 family protein|nr:Hsp20/alpha crystallin family protein [Gemmataceae bacterium]
MARDRVLRSSYFRPPAEDHGWQPALDVYEFKDGWLLKADLAGVRPSEVTVSLRGRVVTLRGHRHDWAVEEGCAHYRMEIAYSSFERSIELPGDPDASAVATDYRDGMLLIRIRRGNPSK